MKNNEIKEPVQKRSIEKKARIIDAGLKLMLENGYHQTNTDEIAKAAGVSTGILYRYFTDKKAILLAGLPIYFDKMEKEQFWGWSDLEIGDTKTFFETLLEKFLAIHRDFHAVHEELETMRHSDPDVAHLYQQFETSLTQKLCSLLIQKNVITNHPKENVCIIWELMEGFCHLATRDEPQNLDYEYMKLKVINTIVCILEQ